MRVTVRVGSKGEREGEGVVNVRVRVNDAGKKTGDGG